MFTSASGNWTKLPPNTWIGCVTPGIELWNTWNQIFRDQKIPPGARSGVRVAAVVRLRSDLVAVRVRTGDSPVLKTGEAKEIIFQPGPGYLASPPWHRGGEAPIILLALWVRGFVIAHLIDATGACRQDVNKIVGTSWATASKQHQILYTMNKLFRI